MHQARVSQISIRVALPLLLALTTACGGNGSSETTHVPTGESQFGADEPPAKPVYNIGNLLRSARSVVRGRFPGREENQWPIRHHG